MIYPKFLCKENGKRVYTDNPDLAVTLFILYQYQKNDMARDLWPEIMVLSGFLHLVLIEFERHSIINASSNRHHPYCDNVHLSAASSSEGSLRQIARFLS